MKSSGYAQVCFFTVNIDDRGTSENNLPVEVLATIWVKDDQDFPGPKSFLRSSEEWDLTKIFT